MLFGGLILLACLSYFLHEAIRAPVFENDEPGGAAEAAPDCGNIVARKLQTAIHHRLARGVPGRQV
jgi:hypothetical protein